MGTSLEVAPVSTMVGAVGAHCPRVLINLTRVGESAPDAQPADSDMHYGDGRDFFLQAKCDQAVEALASALGVEVDTALSYSTPTDSHSRRHRRRQRSTQ